MEEEFGTAALAGLLEANFDDHIIGCVEMLSSSGVPLTGGYPSCETFRARANKTAEQGGTHPNAILFQEIESRITLIADSTLRTWNTISSRKRSRSGNSSSGDSKAPSVVSAPPSEIGSRGPAAPSSRPESTGLASKRIRSKDPQLASGQAASSNNQLAAALNAIADGSGVHHRPGADLPTDVAIFFPLIGYANMAASAVGDAFDDLANTALILEGTSAMALSEAELKAASFCLDSVEDNVKAKLGALQRRILECMARVKRAYDVYTLATRTNGCSWLTVEQLIFREGYDKENKAFNPLYKPLDTWEDKVAAAIVACGQNGVALGKDGNLRGPLSPSVAKAMAQRRQSSTPATSAPNTPPSRSLFQGRGHSKGRGSPAQSGLKKKLAPKTGGGAGRPARKQSKEAAAAENKDAGA